MAAWYWGLDETASFMPRLLSVAEAQGSPALRRPWGIGTIEAGGARQDTVKASPLAQPTGNSSLCVHLQLLYLFSLLGDQKLRGRRRTRQSLHMALHLTWP